LEESKIKTEETKC